MSELKHKTQVNYIKNIVRQHMSLIRQMFTKLIVIYLLKMFTITQLIELIVRNCTYILMCIHNVNTFDLLY